MKILGPQPVSRPHARQPADDPHDSVADDPSEQMAYALGQIALSLSAIEHNLEALTQAVLALARQQGAQRGKTARLLATQRHAERARPERPVVIGPKRRERARAAAPPKPAADAEARSPSATPAE